jgi:glycosyltransferase involved in cell wall biosynthesis
MRIAVDARLICGPLNGIARYTTEMSKAISEINPDIHLYAPGRLNAVAKDRLGGINIKPSYFNSRPGKMFWSQSLLPWTAKKDKVDVFWGPTHRLPNLLPHSIARVVTIHDLVWMFAPETMRSLSYRLEKILVPQAVRLADLIIADSQSTADQLAFVFPGAKYKTRVVYLGKSQLPHPGSTSNLLELGVSRPYFLFVGTLEPRKNLKRLLKAFSLLSIDLKQSALLVIVGGSGWGGVNITALIEQFGLSGSVFISGFVNDAQLSTLYANAQFLVMPSIYEGFGLPLVEAMSFGVPILTSHSSSLPEVAGPAGFYVDPLSVESIANGLLVMLTNESIRDNLSIEAKVRADQFSWKNSAKAALSVFEEAIDVRKSRINKGK